MLFANQLSAFVTLTNDQLTQSFNGLSSSAAAVLLTIFNRGPTGNISTCANYWNDATYSDTGDWRFGKPQFTRARATSRANCGR